MIYHTNVPRLVCLSFILVCCWRSPIYSIIQSSAAIQCHACLPKKARDNNKLTDTRNVCLWWAWLARGGKLWGRTRRSVQIPLSVHTINPEKEEHSTELMAKNKFTDVVEQSFHSGSLPQSSWRTYPRELVLQPVYPLYHTHMHTHKPLWTTGSVVALYFIFLASLCLVIWMTRRGRPLCYYHMRCSTTVTRSHLRSCHGYDYMIHFILLLTICSRPSRSPQG